MKKYFYICFVSLIYFFPTHPSQAQWILSGLNDQYFTILTVEGANIYAVVPPGVYRSTNNGTDWTSITNNLPNFEIKSLVTNGSDLFAGTYGGGVFLSTNNGNNWIAAGMAGNVIFSLLTSDTNLYAGTYDRGVFRSTNNGTTWTSASTGLTGLPRVNILGTIGMNIFAGTHGSGIFRSSNNGTDWTEINTGLTNYTILAFAMSGSNVFAGTFGGGVFLSTNNGTNWTAMNTGLTNNTVFSLAVSGSNIFAGTYGGGVFLSTNNGSNWFAVNSGLTNDTVHALAVSGQYLFAGTFGSGVYRRPLSEMIPSAVSPNEQLSFALENHPNPFTTSTSVSFTLPVRSFVTLDVYDLLGRKVQSLVSGMMDAGSESVQFEAGELPVGLYTAILSTAGNRHEMKMIKISN